MKGLRRKPFFWYMYMPQGPAEMEEGLKQVKIDYSYQGKKYTLTFDEDLRDTITLLVSWLQVKEVITIQEFTAIFLKTLPTDAIKVFRTFGVSTKSLTEVFEKNLESDKDGGCEEEKEEREKDNPAILEIPDEFKGFVKNLNEQYKERICDISGRDKECISWTSRT